MIHRTASLAVIANEEPVSDVALLPPLLSIAKAIRQLLGIKLAECGVAPGQDQFLLCFVDRTPRSVAEIAACLSVRASTVSKMTDILEVKGWVSRTADAHDARKVLVFLPQDGSRVRNEVRGIWRGLEAELTPGISGPSRALDVLAEIDTTLGRRLRRLR